MNGQSTNPPSPEVHPGSVPPAVPAAFAPYVEIFSGGEAVEKFTALDPHDNGAAWGILAERLDLCAANRPKKFLRAFGLSKMLN